MENDWQIHGHTVATDFGCSLLNFQHHISAWSPANYKYLFFLSQRPDVRSISRPFCFKPIGNKANIPIPMMRNPSAVQDDVSDRSWGSRWNFLSVTPWKSEVIRGDLHFVVNYSKDTKTKQYRTHCELELHVKFVYFYVSWWEKHVVKIRDVGAEKLLVKDGSGRIHA